MATTIKAQKNRYERASLPDHASHEDDRCLPIDKVGIEDLSYPIQVLDKSRKTQSTVASISLSVGLPAQFKGTHMSRFVEVLNAVRGEMTVRNLPKILARIQDRLEADQAFIKVEFPYFISKKAPVSGVESLMQYSCAFEASRKGTEFDFTLHVSVPVTTLCPCSKAISDYGAHNQRGMIDVQVRADDFLWIEDVISAVESCASAPLYALLKREDEKFVTEQAYDNPKFVEDMVRDTVIALRELEGVSSLQVNASNHESIHNHAAFGFIRWSRDSESGSGDAPTPLRSQPAEPGAWTDFGPWLKTQRTSRNYGQQEFSEMLGISASYLSRLENGSRQLTRDLAHSLGEILSIAKEEVEIRAGYAPTNLIPSFLASLAQG
jgi:GTP cyclohydrolase IB